MPSVDIPLFGNLVLCLSMVSAAYAFALSIAAGRGRPQLLGAARWGGYATIGFVVVATCLLAYAFHTHDFRLRYVARYSDRSMGAPYLFAALWGGQDGSLLWWCFLLAGYSFACLRWMRGRFLELQPWVIATLMSVFLFFLTVMLFAANPFATYAASLPADGEGLNPLLQNYWMIIHPPALYMGFVGWAVPFGFVVAALMTGRMHDEWVKAARPWAMTAWLFLSIGLVLGCVWSYEELGWGGYWAWDPVENASFMPWLIGTAYLHSAMVQERYGMLKVWNVFLLLLTFFMTIFGTFLTRSGLIASVHSFARSELGIYFVYYMGFLIVACVSLVIWRLPKLKAEHKLQSLLSREFFFLLNNWVLLGVMLIVLVFTTFPLLSEWFRGEVVTVGPAVYNTWLVPVGLTLLFLTGVGPLVSWRKASGKQLSRALIVPATLAVVVMVAHVAFGASLSYPPVLDTDAIYDTLTGEFLARFQSVYPLFATTTCSFVLGCILQEFVRGARVRMRSKGENFVTATARLMSRARRRYGGYLVHIGIVCMFFGFTGAAYDIEREAALRPGGSMTVGDYTLRYDGPRNEVDPNKRAIYTDLTVFDADGDELGQVSPAKFIYRTHPEMPTTEVYIRTRPFEDLYVIMATVDPQTQRATFRAIARPFIMWIWLGGVILVLGAVIAMWPRTRDLVRRAEQQSKRKKRQKKRVGDAGSAAAAVMLVLAIPWGAASAQDSSSLHAGTVQIQDPEERLLFGRLLCECGDCQRLPMDSCSCGWAENKRTELRALLAAGHSPQEIQAQYRAQYGAAALTIPADEGFDRALWVVPFTLVGIAAIGVFVMGRRWRDRGHAAQVAVGDRESDDDEPGTGETDYASRLDDELARLERDD